MTNSNKLPFVRPEFSPLSIARMIWKRKVLIVAIWVVVSVAAYFVVARIPAVYTANALIVVDSQKIPERFVSSTVTTDARDRLTAISQQILSSARMKALIDEFGLYHHQRDTDVSEDVLMRMRSDIAISLERGSSDRLSSFRVGYNSADRAIVAQVANRVANFFIEENLKSREVLAEGTSEFIETQLQESKRVLDQLEAAVSRYKVQHSGELPQQEAALLGTLGRLQAELRANSDGINRAQESKLMLENSLHMAEATLLTMVKTVGGTQNAPRSRPAATRTPQARPLRSSAIIQADLDKLRLRYSDEHPDVKRLKTMLSEAQEAESREDSRKVAAPAPVTETADNAADVLPAATAGEGAEIRQARERVSALKTQIQAKSQEREALEADQERIRRDMRGVQARIDKLPFREQEMAQITRDYDTQKQNYQSLLGKKMGAEMATDLEKRQKSERFSILELARTPDRPFKPNRRVYNAIGSAVGFGLGLLLGLALELKRNTILGEWELPANTVVLARLPLITTDNGPAGPPRDGGGAGKTRGLAVVTAFICAISVAAAMRLRGF